MRFLEVTIAAINVFLKNCSTITAHGRFLTRQRQYQQKYWTLKKNFGEYHKHFYKGAHQPAIMTLGLNCIITSRDRLLGDTLSFNNELSQYLCFPVEAFLW